MRIQEAVRLLRTRIPDLVLSSLYTSAPMYVEQQPEFVNAVGVATTDLGPNELFVVLKSAEYQIGRRPGPPNGPRTIDLDLIAYGSLSYSFYFEDGAGLLIPHPRLGERRFVLEPLQEIAPELIIPGHPSLSVMVEKVRGQELRKMAHARI